MHKKQNLFSPSGIKWPSEVDMLLNKTQTWNHLAAKKNKLKLVEKYY